MYTLGKLLGKGGYGKVYEGEYEGKSVAIKITRKASPAEINVLNTAIGKHFVPIYKIITKPIDETTQETIIIMQKCKYTLSELKNIKMPKKIAICRQLIDAVYDLHNLNIAHMDIKPSNIMLSKNVVKLMDFGLSNMAIIGSRYMGTLKYMAPEVAAAGSKIYDNFAADIWSLGATMVQLLFNLDMSQLAQIQYDVTDYLTEKDSALSLLLVNKIHLKESCDVDLLALLHDMLRMFPHERPNVYDLKSSKFYLKYSK